MIHASRGHLQSSGNSPSYPENRDTEEGRETRLTEAEGGLVHTGGEEGMPPEAGTGQEANSALEPS